MARHGDSASQADRHAATGGRRSAWYAALTALLAAAGIALLAVGCAASRPGPPQPPAAAAGTIAAGPLSAQATSSAPDSSAVGVTSNTDVRAGVLSPETPEPPESSPPTNLSTTGPTQTTTSAATPSDPHATQSASPGSATGHAKNTRTESNPKSPSGPIITGPVLPESAPVSLSVPAIGVNTPLLRLGLNSDGTIQVPPLDDPDSKAGWYDRSPAPGTPGPAIILGHVDSAKYGPGVFYRLGDLKPGERIDITRTDGTVAVFRIDAVRSYSKSDFPTLQVYGNIDHAGLRLITCGGEFDSDAHSYENNIVVYASLQSSHRGP
jgi:sortase (surface protein transpeptidase)